MECVNCSRDYVETRKPCVGTCGHEICIRCAKTPKCPICSKPDAFLEPCPNYSAWELLQNMEPKDKRDSVWQDEQKLTEGTCSECASFSRKLRLCTSCAEKEGLIRKFGKHWILKAKSVDNQKEFQRLKSRAICADCEIDKGTHRAHGKVEKLKDVVEWNLHLKSDLSRNSVEERFERITVGLEKLKFGRTKKKKVFKMKLPAKHWLHVLQKQTMRIEKEKWKVQKENAKIKKRGEIFAFEDWNLLHNDKLLQLPYLPQEEIRRSDKTLDNRIKEILSIEELAVDFRKHLEKIWEIEEKVAEIREMVEKKKKVYEDVQRFEEPKLIVKAVISVMKSRISLENARKSGEKACQEVLMDQLVLKKFMRASRRPHEFPELAHLISDPLCLTKLVQTYVPNVRFVLELE